MINTSQLRHTAKLIYESKNSLIYYQEVSRDEPPLIIKTLRQDHPSPEQMIKITNEYECIRDLDAPGVRKAYKKITIDGKPALVLGFVEGQTLKEVIAEQKTGLESALRIAILTARALENIHAHRLIHKDINSDNIIVNRQGPFLVTIIDFGISSGIDMKTTPVGNPDKLEGTLAYISPEQTGRMNRTVDYRTDLYSLGITFYEMLTGQLPFETDDSMEMIHSHIARSPKPVCEVNPGIPKMISDIVVKLMAKNAEDRYQSAFGLRADLEQCLEALKKQTVSEPFKLGCHDISDQLYIPQKLYGRDREISILLEAFERISRGTTELILVSGYSGVGKSSLVREICKPVIKRRGYFVTGKYDQYQRNMPYASIIQALTEFADSLLTESSEQLDIWKEKISEAVGNNGQVLTDLVPAFESVIGKQPPVPELDAEESRNRINMVFKNIIKAISRKEHPFVMFADDLQWADSASLNLIRMLMNDEESRHLLFIGAYRDNEVYSTHPLIMMLNEIREKNVAEVNTVRLGNLFKEQVNELIADSLHCERSYAEPLTELVYGKTRGNAFFVNQFLKSLTEEKLLIFDHEKRQWVWDVPQIQEKNITDNVVELMANKLRRLPAATQAVLKFAACIGNIFDINTLAVIYKHPHAQTLEHLSKSIEEGLILPLDEQYKLISLQKNKFFIKSQVTSSFRFLHDRVQQGAYCLIPETQRKALHWKIGQLMLDYIPEKKYDEQIFNIVNHLNQGADKVSDLRKREELAQLNLTAGKKSMVSGAFESAFDYLKNGIEMLESDSWERQYNLTLALYSEATEAAALSGNFKEMENLFQKVMQNSRKVPDKVRAYQSKIQSYVSQGKLQDALDTALGILEQLGEKFSAHPPRSYIRKVLRETREIYSGKNIGELKGLPEMKDKVKIAVMRILAQSTAAAYIGRPGLFQLFIFKKVSLSIRYGNSPDSPYGYACYALILCGADVGDFENGYQFGKLATDVLEKLKADKFRSKVLEVVNGHVWHFKKHLRETLSPLKVGYQSGKETGDLEYAGYNAFFYSCNAFFSGRELKKLEQEMAAYNEGIREIRAETARRWQGSFWQATQNLLGKSENPCQLIGEAYDQEKMLPILKETDNQAAMGALYVNRLLLCYLFGEYQEAIENSELAEKNKGGLVAMYAVPVLFFYDSLARTAIYSDCPESEQQGLMEKIAGNHQMLKKWADHAPVNHLHKWHLVEAERLRIQGNPVETVMEHYEQAAELAKKHEYINEEALANELTAKFWLAKGKKDIAGLYMKRACYCYHLWGAKRKLLDIREKHSDLLEPEYVQQSTFISGILKTSSADEKSISESGSMPDMTSILKFSQAISGEINLDMLLQKLMKILIENAGAQAGYFLLPDENTGAWRIQAEGSVDREECEVMQNLSLESTDKLAVSIVKYVSRTGKMEVQNDAAKTGNFRNDPYVLKNGSKSVLCFPVIHQGKISAILYLSNDLATGVFTQNRVTLLQMLSSQVAVSVDNALLYRKLEQKVRELTLQIRARRRTEEALQESEVRFRNLFENSPVSLWEEDFSGVKSYLRSLDDVADGNFDQYLSDHPEVLARCAELVRIIDINRASLELHGADTKEELLENLAATFTPESYQAFQKEILAIWEGRHQVKADTVVQTLSGDPRYVSLRWQISPGHEETLSRVLVSLSDIGERKKAEDQLTAINLRLEKLVDERTRALAETTEKVRAADKAKSEFLARMSHEIRTPLNGIIGLTNLVLKSDLTSQQEHHLKKIRESSAHLLNIINDILDFSRIEEGRPEIETRDFMLNHIVGKLADITGQRASEKEVELFYLIDKDVPLSLTGDPLRLNQILINLMDNAVKFTEKGEIILRVLLSDKPKAENRVELLFTVQDTGIGISPEKIGTLFRPFIQADGSVRRKYGGTGLGLAICRQLVNLMGGQIWAESAEGKGSTFCFTLPFIFQPKEKPYVMLAPQNVRGLKVMVASANETARIIFRDMLEAFDSFQVAVADSGKNALDELRKALHDKPYDLVVLDRKMPDANGFEIVRQIRSDPLFMKEGAMPRLIMVTMYGREEVFQQAKPEKKLIDRVVHKPVSSSEMFNAVMEVFGCENAVVPREKRETEETDSEALRGIRGARVLLVEDNEINRNVALALLEEGKLTAEVAENGLEAVKMLRTLTDDGAPLYDAILMDIEMPEMDGYEATRTIRALPRCKDLPVIAMTAHAMKGDRERCLKAGMSDYLSKPVDEKQLYAALCKWIKPEKRNVPEDNVFRQKTIPRMSPAFPSVLPGINLEAALKRFRYNEKQLKRMLRNFSEKYEHAADDVRKFLDEGRIRDAQRLVHSIKGVSGNLCAEDLFLASQDLDKALRQEKPENIPPLKKAFEQKLITLITSLKSMEPEEKKAVPSPKESGGKTDTLQIGQVMREMYSLLKKKRLRAWKLTDTLMPLLPDAEFHEEKIILEKSVPVLDTQTALSVLSELAQKLNISLKEKS